MGDFLDGHSLKMVPDAAETRAGRLPITNFLLAMLPPRRYFFWLEALNLGRTGCTTTPFPLKNSF